MKTHLSIILAGLCVLTFGKIASRRLEAAEQNQNPRIDVILWFDTEDYLLPASDDAAKRLAELLTERGIRATFKVVGEKARTLERRGRGDVIESLRKHEIGYHANFHSVHPTPTEYLAECGWLDGVAEFARREGAGAAHVRRIFNVPTLACYGQPGSSWAPQAIGALRQIGIAPHDVPCYVDEGTHVGIDQKPFWYAGALNVYHMGDNYTRMELHDPAMVEPGKKKFSDISNRLKSENGGLISIFYHPCEWVHREFWDGVNFANGANPPRELWKAPPQRTSEETDGAFRRFAEYIDFIKSVPGVRFITAADLPAIYRDRTMTEGASQEELGEIVSALLNSRDGIAFRVLNGKSFSAADQFDLLTRAVGELMQKQAPKFPLLPRVILGPDPASATSILPQNPSPAALRTTVSDVSNYLSTQHRIPARIFFGSDAISPADFLYVLASAYSQLNSNPQKETIQLLPETALSLKAATYVANDTPNLYGGWVIHKHGFRAPKVVEQAKLQAWTLKPAIRAE
ncbi:MAG: hypothetical protein JWM99_877 [Verrucomicrobiales bacterium]|nr:hypothetical protein [Verrucomicrobiales bacterium]